MPGFPAASGNELDVGERVEHMGWGWGYGGGSAAVPPEQSPRTEKETDIKIR